MKQYDIAAIGELNVDIILNHIESEPEIIESEPEIGKEKFAKDMTVTLGSSTAIFAANAAALGSKVCFVGLVGCDSFGDLVCTSLEAKGVETRFIKKGETPTGATICMNYGEDRANLTYQGSMDVMGFDDIDPEVFESASHIHLSSLFMQSGLLRDIHKVLDKAVEKGMISEDEANSLDDADAVRLIFLPGFSTAEVVTDVSGRGVGMDVVRSKIETLGGHVDVETKIDEGSVFKIKLPLTLAIIQALLVKVQEEMYAIPLGSIDSTINITQEDIKTVRNKEVIVLRGQIIPIIRLGDILNVPRVHEGDSDDIFVVVVHIGERKAGIVVDNLIGQQEIVIKTLGKLLAGLKVISGATVLGDGRVAMILDVSALM